MDEELARDQALAAAIAAANRVMDEIASRMRASVQRAITAEITTHQHAYTAGLPDQDLTDLKAELATLIADLPARVRLWLDDPELWLHRGTVADHRWPIASADEDAGPRHLMDELAARAHAVLKTLVEKYGYAERPELGERFTWRGDLNAAVIRYVAAAVKLRAADRALLVARKAQAIRDATARWTAA